MADSVLGVAVRKQGSCSGGFDLFAWPLPGAAGAGLWWSCATVADPRAVLATTTAR
jgi:hypothetical protein